MITPSPPEGELAFWEYQPTHNLERATAVALGAELSSPDRADSAREAKKEVSTGS
jgi:hypothetical protein